MGSAENERLEAGPATNVEDADALRGVQFVPGDAEEMAADRLDVDGNLARGLHGVSVKRDFGFGGDFADLLDGLNDAGFIVGHHDADEFCVRLERAVNVERIDNATPGDGEVGDIDAPLLRLLGGVQNSVVLDGGRDEVIAGAQDAEDGGIVTLGAAGVEDDFGGTAVEERGNLFAGALDGGAGVLAVLVDGGRVAERVDEEGSHSLQYLGKQRCGGIGVHVDAAHTSIVTGLGSGKTSPGGKKRTQVPSGFMQN